MPILYKYLPSERIDILTSGFLMLTRPRLFNDPFELRPHYESIDELQLPVVPNATAAQLEWIKKEQQIINEKVLPPSAKATILDNATQTIVVLSLAENRESLLMWAHYADGHTGFLIGFDSEQKILAIDSPHRHMDKVKYQMKRPSQVTFEAISNDELLLTKSKEWEYEGEWRILDSLYSADGEMRKDLPDRWPFKFSPSAVKEIIVGCRSGDLATKIEPILEQPKYKHVTRLKAVPDQEEYRLNIVPLWLKEW
jgi:hypothetical protein